MTFSLVLKSKSSFKIKVKYQGHVSKTSGYGGINVSQTLLVSYVFSIFIYDLYQPLADNHFDFVFKISEHCEIRKKLTETSILRLTFCKESSEL